MGLSRRALSAAAFGTLAAARAHAGFPDRPIQIVVPFAAGGGVDAVTRIVAAGMAEALGSPVVVDNRGGGGTAIGTQAVVRAAADGATLLAAPTTMVVNAALGLRLPYDWRTDLEPILLLTRLPFVVVAGQGLPAAGMGELAELGRRTPDGLTFGSSGPGTVAHLSARLFGVEAGVRMVAVPYPGEGPAIIDTITGRIAVLFSTLASASSHVAGGQLKALGVTTARRAGLLPDVPTVAEQGFPGYDLAAWVALAAPRGTPPAVLATLNEAANRTLSRPDVRERLIRIGAEPEGGTPEALAAFMRRDAAAWADLLARTGAD